MNCSMPKTPVPPFRLTLTALGVVFLDCTERWEGGLLSGLRRTITKDGNGRITQLGLSVDLERIPPELAAEIIPDGGRGDE